ncbi:hypothetical protein AAHA92_04329 [Salvia divinorum]|uniref:Uncharacterized protein n=1 Tax=Salvia divinorum TaxID=28513 RepID=A0ABD1HYV6_SALDI
MAHYDAHKGRGYDGYGVKDPMYGGRPAAVMAYSATEERYMASSEQVVKYSDYTTRPDLHDQGWPRRPGYPQLKKGDEYDHSPRFGHVSGSPRGSPRKAFQSPNSPPAAGHFSSVYAPHLDSPRKNYRNNDHPGAYHGGHPPNNSRDGRGGRFSSDDDSSDDEVECRDGVCYPKPKRGGRRQSYDYDYGNEKNKANGHAAGNYPVQHYTDHQPRKDPHYHQPSNGENNIYGSHSYKAPAHAKPTTDAYYDRYPAANDDHNRSNYTHSKNEPYYAVPAPVKTRPDHGDSGRSSPVSAMAQWTPFAASSPRNAPPQTAPPMSRGAAIDCETAARKYGGVFVK